MTNQNIQESARTKPKLFYGYIIVLAALSISIATYGIDIAFGVFFKPMLAEFGWSRAATSGAYSLSVFLSGLVGIAIGALSDKFGPRLVTALCGVFIGSGYMLMSGTNAIWQLYLFYGVIRGIGLGGPYVVLSSTVARWFTKRRGVMTGIVSAGMGIGTLLAPPIANRLIYAYDWRTSYLILGIFALVVIISGAQFLIRDPAQKGQRSHGEGKVVDQRARGRTDSLSLGDAVRTRQLWLLIAMFLCYGTCIFAIVVHIVPHATDLGISPASAANILAAVGGASILGRISMGSVADRIGNRQAYIICFILLSAASLWLTVATELWAFYLFAIILGFAWGALAVHPPLVAELFGLSTHGLLLGVSAIGYTTGGGIGPYVAGYIFDVTHSYQLVFLMFAVVGIVGIILTVLLRPIKGKRDQNLELT